jgi:hypothetical protein
VHPEPRSGETVDDLDIGVNRMSNSSTLLALGLAAALAAPAFPQEPATAGPVRIVTKTLVAQEAQKECFSLNERQKLVYKFRADGPLDFKLSHQQEGEVIDVRRDRADSAAGSFVPRKAADHCLVWTNTGKRAVTLRYEFQRGPH